MRNTWIGQPLEAFGGWTADWLNDVLLVNRATNLRMAVAWVKRSGLSRLEPMFRTFQQRGGRVEAIIGIDEGGATRQGLEGALELFSTVHVFHDPGARTFHPKVYVAWSDARADVIVGSNNLTAGGLFSNYEASMVCTMDFSEDGDKTFFEMVQSWYDTLLADEEVCLPLTTELLRDLSAESRYKIGDESRGRARRDSDSVTEDKPGESFFGRSQSAKKGLAPAPSRLRKHAGRRRKVKARRSLVARPRRLRITHRWWKKMSASDAQQPPDPDSNITGQLKLTQSGFNIDHKRYFRHDLFRGVHWSSQPVRRGTKEEAIIPFAVTIDGRTIGTLPLKVDHADFRAANQENVTTWLHWGNLATLLRQRGRSDSYAVITRYDDGTYSLDVTQTRP